MCLGEPDGGRRGLHNGGIRKSTSVWQAFTTFAFMIIIMSVYCHIDMWFTTAYLLLDNNTRVTDRATDTWSNYPLVTIMHCTLLWVDYI